MIWKVYNINLFLEQNGFDISVLIQKKSVINIGQTYGYHPLLQLHNT